MKRSVIKIIKVDHSYVCSMYILMVVVIDHI